MDKNDLFADRLNQADVEVPGVGTIRVRSMSRVELLLAGKLQEQGVAAMEKRMLHYALIDPQLSEAEVERWMKAAPAGEIQPVVNKINELSGIGQYAQKEAYKSLPGESGDGVRVLPGAEAGDDGGPSED